MIFLLQKINIVNFPIFDNFSKIKPLIFLFISSSSSLFQLSFNFF